MDYTDDTDCVLCLKLTAEARRWGGVLGCCQNQDLWDKRMVRLLV
jgi:hypothetical protein